MRAMLQIHEMNEDRREWLIPAVLEKLSRAGHSERTLRHAI
jgi:hypothetical protein